jgi:hypothetical protein
MIEAGNAIETHEHADEFKEPQPRKSGRLETCLTCQAGSLSYVLMRRNSKVVAGFTTSPFISSNG